MNFTKKSFIIVCLSILVFTFGNCGNNSFDKDTEEEQKSNAAIAASLVVNKTSNGSGTGSPSFTISGTITGLSASGLVLQNNRAEDLTVASGAATFSFSTKVTGYYLVTVKTQPGSLLCSVSSETGNATGDVNNVSISCNSCGGSKETYNWGVFTDCQNGTVALEIPSGRMGTVKLKQQIVYFAKCTYGQTYNSATNDCTGTGDSTNDYGATTVQLCATNHLDCRGGNKNNPISSGPAFNACNGMNLDGRSWRIASQEEMQMIIHCTDKRMIFSQTLCGAGNYTSPSISNLFPNTVWANTSNKQYWTPGHYAGDTNSTSVHTIDFYIGDMNDISSGGYAYTGNAYLRCVSGP